MSVLYWFVLSCGRVTRSIVYTEQGENRGTRFSMGLVTPPIHFGMGHTVGMEEPRLVSLILTYLRSVFI